MWAFEEIILGLLIILFLIAAVAAVAAIVDADRRRREHEAEMARLTKALRRMAQHETRVRPDDGPNWPRPE